MRGEFGCFFCFWGGGEGMEGGGREVGEGLGFG